MTAETLGGTMGLNSPVLEGKYSDEDCEDFLTNGTDIFVGAPVSRTGESNKDVDLSLAADKGFVGVVIGLTYPPENYDIDGAIADNTWVKVLKPMGGKVKMVGKYLTGVADDVNYGKGLEVLDGGKLGMLGAAAEHGIVIGRAASEITGHASEDRLITYWY